MTPEQIKKAGDDAAFLVSSVAMAAVRTTVARRAADDALAEENRLTALLCEAIRVLTKAAQAPSAAPKGDE